MQHVRYSPNLQRDRALFPLVENASRQLDEELARSSVPVSADWDRADDARGRPVLILRLSDFSGAVTAALDPDELEDSRWTRLRVNLLWGDLLQIRNHKQLEQLLRKESDNGA